VTISAAADDGVVVILSYNSRLYHIGVGRAHSHNPRHHRSTTPRTDPRLTRNYQPQNHKSPSRRRGKYDPCLETYMNDVWRHDKSSPDGIRTRATALRGRCPRPLDNGAVHCSLGYQDSNLDLLNQNQQGCQLPHTPIYRSLNRGSTSR
jgi:hypothetical protein